MRKLYLKAAHDAQTSALGLEELVEHKRRVRQQLHALMTAQAPPASASASNPALVKQFSAKLRAVDGRIAKASRRWRTAAWRAALAKTALEEAVEVKKMLGQQVVQVCVSVCLGADCECRRLCTQPFSRYHRCLAPWSARRRNACYSCGTP